MHSDRGPWNDPDIFKVFAVTRIPFSLLLKILFYSNSLRDTETTKSSMCLSFFWEPDGSKW